MRVLLVCDRYFVKREYPLVERLEIGLADEGVRLTVALPEDVAIGEQLSLLSNTVNYRLGGLGWTRSLRASWLLSQMRARTGAERVDLVHVFGGAAWNLGLEVGRQLDVPVLLEVWRYGLVNRARGVAARHGGRAVLLAPDPAVERGLLRQASGALVRQATWGVPTPPEPSMAFREGRIPGVMVLGQARESGTYLSAFTAAAEAVRSRAEGLLFVDAGAARRVPLWKLAKSMGVRGRVSVIDEMEAQRGLVLHGDLIVYPEASGEQRTILLDAMAAGLPVIASEDPNASFLVQGKTARLVDGSSGEAWRRAIEEVAGDPAKARELGMSAREWVREHRRSSTYIASILGTYEWTLSSDAIPFRRPAAGAA